MRWSDMPIDPSRRTLRQFAGLWVLFFGGLACWQGLGRGHTGTAAVLAALALTVGPAGLVRPRAVRWVYVGWMVLALPVGWTVSRLLLAAVFYGVVTPLGLALRLAGRDPLARRRRPDGSTYWESRPAASDARSYLRQF